MKKVIATTMIEVICECPYCEESMDVMEEVIDYIDVTPSVVDCNVTIRCDGCDEEFIVTDVEY